MITVIFDKFKIFTVGDQIFGSSECRYLSLMRAILIVPAKQLCIFALPQCHPACRYINKFILRCVSVNFTLRPVCIFPYHFKRELAYQYRRGLKMDVFMFDTHQYDPPWRFPADRKFQRKRIYQIGNQCIDLIPVLLCLFQCRPVIMFFIKIIPGHLIHTDSKDRFQMWIYPCINDLCKFEFVDEKCSSMPIVEDNGVSKRIGFLEIGLFICNKLKKGFITFVTELEIRFYFPALFFTVNTGKCRYLYQTSFL